MNAVGGTGCRPGRAAGRRTLVVGAGLLVATLLATLPPARAGVSDDPSAPLHLVYGDAADQDMFCWSPPVPSGRLVVVTVHGGSWVRGHAMDRISELNRRLLAAGVPSCSVNYRLATAAPWPAQRHDLAAALDTVERWARRWRIAAPAVAVIGESVGGHLALDAASRGSGGQRVCAAISYSAPTSIGLSARDAAGGARQARLARAQGTLAPDHDRAADATLPHDASADDAPALLFASRREWVSPAHTRRYVSAFVGKRAPVRAVYLPGSRHALAYALSDPAVWSASTSFLRRHCGTARAGHAPWLAAGLPATGPGGHSDRLA